MSDVRYAINAAVFGNDGSVIDYAEKAVLYEGDEVTEWLRSRDDEGRVHDYYVAIEERDRQAEGGWRSVESLNGEEWLAQINAAERRDHEAETKRWWRRQ